jgi:hypothetical protein
MKRVCNERVPLLHLRVYQFLGPHQPKQQRDGDVAANRDETIEAMISEETESPKTSKGFAYTIEVQQ